MLELRRISSNWWKIWIVETVELDLFLLQLSSEKCQCVLDGLTQVERCQRLGWGSRESAKTSNKIVDPLDFPNYHL